MGTIADNELFTFVAGEIPTASNWNTNPSVFQNRINGNIDSDNTTNSGAKGLMTLADAQTATGKKTFSKTAISAIEDVSAAAGGVRTAVAFRHDPASGTAGDNDGVEVLFQGDDDGGNQTNFGEIECVFTDVSDTTEDGQFIFKTMSAGTSTAALTISPSAATIPGATQLNNTLTVGVDDTGYDVKLFGATSGSYWLWDESTDTMAVIAGQVGLGTLTPTANYSPATITPMLHINSNVSPAIILSDPSGGGTQQSYMWTDGAGYRLGVSGAATATNNVITFLTEDDNSTDAPDERMRITSAGNVGINTTGPESLLEVNNASATCSISIVAGSNAAPQNAQLLLGDSDSKPQGVLRYTNSADRMDFFTNNTKYMSLTNAGRLGIGTDAPGVLLEVDQGANDDVLFQAASSDVAHARTTRLSTDAYFGISKVDGAEGGVTLTGLCEDGGTNASSFRIIASGGTPATAKNASTQGLMDILVEEHDGADGEAGPTADANLFTVRNRTGSPANLCRFIIDEDGDIHATNNTITALDDFDDVALVSALDHARAPKSVIQSEWEDFTKYNEQDLIDAGILGDTIANQGLVNVTQLQRLHNGAIRQLGRALNRLEAENQQLINQLTEKGLLHA